MKIRTLYVVLILCLLLGMMVVIVAPFLGKVITTLSLVVMGAVELLRKFAASMLELLGIDMGGDFFED